KSLADQLDHLDDLAIAEKGSVQRRGARTVARSRRDRGVRVEQTADVDRRKEDEQEQRTHQCKLDQRLTALATCRGANRCLRASEQPKLTPDPFLSQVLVAHNDMTRC